MLNHPETISDNPFAITADMLGWERGTDLCECGHIRNLHLYNAACETSYEPLTWRDIACECPSFYLETYTPQAC